jgi:hypothetical protein
MTNLLFDAPYNKDERDVFTPRLKHFYFVIPTTQSDEETVAEEIELFDQLQQAMPQWAVQHLITRDALYGPNLPVFTEEYVVCYFTIDEDGNRVPVTIGFSEFAYSDITYAMVSA